MEAFKSYEDQVRYLNRSICMYKGDPVYVRSDTDKQGIVNLDVIKTRKKFSVNITDDAFSTFPFELGYMNMNKNAVFLSRLGVRVSHYGLSASRIFVDKFDKEDISSGPINLPFVPGFVECLNNVYPTLDEALNTIMSENQVVNSIAFHKHFALCKLEDEDIVGVFSMSVDKPFALVTEDRTYVPYLNSKKSNATLNFCRKVGILK